MSKRVLLTGGAGFIGAHCVGHWLKKTDWSIVVVDSLRHRGKKGRIASFSNNPRLSVFEFDLAHPSCLNTLNAIGRCDYVVNMASESHVDRSITDPVQTLRNNTALMVNMLEYARAHTPEKFIQISTDEVYGPALHDTTPDGHAEWSAILPSNPYAASKAAQEAMAISYWRSYGIPIAITNTMNNFGEYQDVEKFIPKIIKHLMEGQSVPVHGRLDEVGSRYYLHAKNHADALLYILTDLRFNKYPNDLRPSRWNITGDREVSNFSMVRHVAKFLNTAPKCHFVNFHEARPGHDVRYGLDGTLLARHGWTPPMDFLTSLEKTVLWFKDHPEELDEYQPEA
jgi:dTDP-glucose 4,6-dehydratase